MRHITDFAFTADDIFKHFDTRKVNIHKEVFAKKYGVNSRRMFCSTVFVYCMHLIMLDIIENNATFVLPLFNGKEASIFIRPIVGEEFKLARQKGAHKDVDIIASNFTGYWPVYQWKNNTTYRYTKSIYMNRKYTDLLMSYVNKGRQYY